MSRSTKAPWIKDSASSAVNKRIQNRRYRRVFRQKTKEWRLLYWRHTEEVYCGFCECRERGLCLFFRLPPEPEFPAPHRFSDKYDVCDFRFFVDEQRYRRK